MTSGTRLGFGAQIRIDSTTTALVLTRMPSVPFGWGMTYIEGEVAIDSTISLSTQLEVSTDGADYYGFGVEVNW